MLYQRTRAAQAAGIAPAVLSQWVTRGLPVLDEGRGDIPGEGRGLNRLFSDETVVQVAIAGRLVRLGFAIEDALLAALAFNIVGGPLGAAVPRHVGKPFPTGATLLFAVGREACVVNAGGVAAADPFDTLLADAPEIAEAFEAGRTAVAVLDVGAIYREVRGRLGVDPEDYRK